MASPNQMELSMNSKAVVSAIVAMCLTTGGSAFAQGQRDRNDHGRSEHARGQQDRRGNEGRQPDRREVQARANNDQRRENVARAQTMHSTGAIALGSNSAIGTMWSMTGAPTI